MLERVFVTGTKPTNIEWWKMNSYTKQNCIIIHLQNFKKDGESQ